MTFKNISMKPLFSLSIFIFVILTFSNCSKKPSVKIIHADKTSNSVNAITDDKMMFGQGYNTVTGQIMDAVLVDTPTTTALPFKDTEYGQKVSLSFSLIENTTDFRNKLGLDFKASLKAGAFSGSSEYKAFNETNINRLSTYFLVSLKVDNPSIILNSQKFKLTDKADAIKNDSALFTESFGNEFVYSMNTGGTFYILYEYNSNSASDKRITNAALSAKVKTLVTKAQINASISTDLQNIETNKQTNITVFGTGICDSFPDLNLNALVNYIKKFPKRVSLKEGCPSITDITTMPIKNLAAITNKKMFRGFIQQSFVLEDCANQIDKLRQFINDANYVKKYEDNFDGVLVSSLNVGIEEAEKKLTSLTRKAKECVDDRGLCLVDISNFGVPNLDPKILQWMTQVEPKELALDEVSISGETIDTLRNVYRTYELRGQYGFHSYFDLNGQFEYNDINSKNPFVIRSSGNVYGIYNYSYLAFQLFDVNTLQFLDEIPYDTDPITIQRKNCIIKVIPYVIEQNQRINLSEPRAGQLFSWALHPTNPLKVYMH